MDWPLFISYLVVCLISSLTMLYLRERKCAYGTLEIDTTYSEDQDMYNVDLGNIDKLPKKDYIKLKIKIKK